MNTTPAPLLHFAADGSCLKNPGGPSGWAWVCSDGRYGLGYTPEGTNQVAELWGVITCLRDNPMGRIVIQCDSKYVVDIANGSAQQWERNGWRTKAGTPTANLALVKTLMRLLRSRPAGHDAQIVKVPGHDSSGRWPLNTVADQLAVRGSKMAQSQKKTGEENGRRKPFTGPLSPSDTAKTGAKGDAPGQRCPSCDAVIRPAPPHCRCDIN